MRSDLDLHRAEKHLMICIILCKAFEKGLNRATHLCLAVFWDLSDLESGAEEILILTTAACFKAFSNYLLFQIKPVFLLQPCKSLVCR